VGAYVLHTIRVHSLPVPHILAAFNLALPAIAGLSLSVVKPSVGKDKQSRWYHAAILLLFIYETVVVTLAGTYLAPVDSLRCGLDDRWQDMFRKHNGKGIRRIQDDFECCGLHSTVDKAFPFPSKEVGVDACKKTFGRKISCFASWREDERRIAGLILMVVLLVAAWQVNNWQPYYFISICSRMHRQS
jgi:hypothetical protein